VVSVAISLNSKKQLAIASSTIEIEYMAAINATKKINFANQSNALDSHKTFL